MSQHNFKIGDRVKVKSSINQRFNRFNNLIGVIESIDNLYAHVRFNTSECVICWSDSCNSRARGKYIHLCNLEPAVEVGEQLMFEFMRGD